MSLFWLGLGIGLVLGAAIGLFAFAFCSVAKEDDNCK